VIRKDRVYEVYRVIDALHVHRHESFSAIIFSDTILVYNDLLKKKQEGKPIERPKERKPSNVVSLDALRKSVRRKLAAESGARPSQALPPITVRQRRRNDLPRGRRTQADCRFAPTFGRR
jgi:hypothetical protein